MEAVIQALQSPSPAAGYVNACGWPEAREAIAAYHNKTTSLITRTTITADQVVVANGCSGALELALTALLDDDSILLVPQPGFPLYQVIAESHGAQVMHYRLIEPTGAPCNSDEKDKVNWECDLQHLRELMHSISDGNRVIRGMVVNNPGNPTGAVFSERHLEQIIDFCDEFQLAVIADEVYGDLTFGKHLFFPLAGIAGRMGRRVPVITASGIGKQFLLPGWRVGWVAFQDK